MITKQALRKLVESNGHAEVAHAIGDDIAENPRMTDTFSLKTCWEGFIGDVEETMPMAMQGVGGIVGNPMFESVQSRAFLHVTGEVLIARVQEAYNRRAGILDELVQPAPSSMREEKFVGFTALDTMQDVEEGEEYADSGFGDRATKGPEPKKRGRAISITDESVLFDRTGQVMDRASMYGEKMAIDRERRGIKAIQDLTDFFAFYPYVDGVPARKALYHDATAGGEWYNSFDNLAASNGLSDWSNLEAAWLLWKNAKDEAGDEILIMPNVLLVPMALLATAASVINAVQVKTGTDQIGGTTLEPLATQTVSANAQISAMGLSGIKILTSPFLTSATTWYLGDFRSQFVEQVIIPTEVVALPGNPMKDIVAGFRVRRKSRVFARDDKYVVKNTA